MGGWKSAALLLVLSGGIYWWFFSSDSLLNTVQTYVESGEFLTLEARYTPEQIMRTHHRELIPNEKYEFQPPSLKFYPYLMMDVKYLQNNRKTKESVILWSMIDGEMILDTENWSKTHGFQDAIRVNASPADFTLLNALAKQRGVMSRSLLQKTLNVDEGALNALLESVRRKQLISEKGAEVRLHFQNPHFDVAPETVLKHWLVTKPYNHAQRERGNYNQKQIEKIAIAAFGSDFVIRGIKEIFLPIYRIEVLNPDGSLLVSYWNALTGLRIDGISPSPDSAIAQD